MTLALRLGFTVRVQIRKRSNYRHLQIRVERGQHLPNRPAELLLFRGVRLPTDDVRSTVVVACRGCSGLDGRLD
jgi:hypothetical protein